MFFFLLNIQWLLTFFLKCGINLQENYVWNQHTFIEFVKLFFDPIFLTDHKFAEFSLTGKSSLILQEFSIFQVLVEELGEYGSLVTTTCLIQTTPLRDLGLRFICSKELYWRYMFREAVSNEHMYNVCQLYRVNWTCCPLKQHTKGYSGWTGAVMQLIVHQGFVRFISFHNISPGRTPSPR